MLADLIGASAQESRWSDACGFSISAVHRHFTSILVAGCLHQS